MFKMQLNFLLKLDSLLSLHHRALRALRKFSNWQLVRWLLFFTQKCPQNKNRPPVGTANEDTLFQKPCSIW